MGDVIDASVRKLIDPFLDRQGLRLARRGWDANTMTFAGIAVGIAAAILIAIGYPGFAMVPLAANRMADGLDGAIARATRKTDFGGYLDIAVDFLFYGLIPMAFVWLDPAANGAAGAFLLASFYFNAASFLGYAVLAERRGMSTTTHGTKTLYFTGGLLEGSETILFFLAICLLPQWFSPLAWVFGALCFVTATSRLLLAHRVFGEEPTLSEPEIP
jgi:phosphatidylglycerophosphate synthase